MEWLLLKHLLLRSCQVIHANRLLNVVAQSIAMERCDKVEAAGPVEPAAEELWDAGLAPELFKEHALLKIALVAWCKL